MEKTLHPATTFIDYHYEEIDATLNSIYAQEVAFPGEFRKLFAIAHYLNTLSSFFSIVMYEKKMEANQSSVDSNLPQLGALQQEILTLQKLLQRNEGVCREVDFFIYRLLVTTAPFTEATQ